MAISKDDIENLYHLTGEITDLEREIKRVEKKLITVSQSESKLTADTYRDYSTNAKGTVKTVIGYGLSDNEYNQQQAYYENLRVKRNRLIARKTELDNELEKIDDVIIRRIIRLKFFDRFSWESVAIAVDPTKSGEAMRKRLDRFFENIS